MSRRFTAFLMGLVLLAGLSTSTSRAQVNGISYTLSPVGKYVSYSDKTGLSDAFMYGGELGFGFGKFMELSGSYVLGNSIKTDFSNYPSSMFTADPSFSEGILASLNALEKRKMDVTRMGGKLRVNIGSGRFIPFVTAGTGVQQLNSDGLEKSEQIYTDLGVGLTFSVANRYTLSVGAENLTYRYNPASTLLSEDDLNTLGMTRQSFNMTTVNSPTLSTSIKIFLGGRSGSVMTDTDRAMLNQFKKGRLRLVLEPFYGQVNFNSALGFPDTRAVAGLNAGFDLGPFIGLRGFYWADTKQETAFDGGLPDGFGDLKMYGGELNLKFRESGLIPYLVVGAGYMDVENSAAFENANGVAAKNRQFAVGGAGLEFPLTSSVKLFGGARGLFMSTEDIEDINGPSSVFGSMMYTGGIHLSLGRKARKPSGTVRPMPVPAPEQPAVAVVQGQPAPFVAVADSPESRVAALEAELKQVTARLDSLKMAQFVEQDAAVGHVAVAKGNISNRTMTIPVPETGEIYIRFGASAGRIVVDSSLVQKVSVDSTFSRMGARTEGMAGLERTDSTAVTADEIYEIVKRVVAEQQGQPVRKDSVAGITAGDLEKSIRQMEERLDKRISKEISKVKEEAPAQDRRVVEEVVIPVIQPVVADSTVKSSNGLLDIFAQRQLDSILPFVGIRLKDGVDRVIFGARSDYRFPDQKVRFMPEVAITVGDAVGISALANAAWFPYDFNDYTHFYAGTGLGFVSDKGLSGLELKLNLFAGVEYTAKTGSTFFGELSTLDFGNYNRINFGYRIKMNK
jgi:hypothetical protein